MTAIKCVMPECTFETTVLKNENQMMKLMELHLSHAHPTAGGTAATSNNKGPGREKAKRPMLGLDVTEDDWSYWSNRIASYLKMTKIEDDEQIEEVKECLEEDLRREVHRQYPNGFTDLQDMLKGLRKLAVKKRNRAVIRDELHKLIQDRGEGVRRFSGRVQALANVGEYETEYVTVGDPQDIKMRL